MPHKVNASHILVKSEQDAKIALYDVTAGNKKFEDVAKEKSMCPSRKDGGNLGWFSRGMMVREFETVAFSLQKNQISQPVKTQFGWHIIKLNDAL